MELKEIQGWWTASTCFSATQPSFAEAVQLTRIAGKNIPTV